jgi:5-methyltetrahydrofolate--homocysteine methyltransferase
MLGGCCGTTPEHIKAVDTMLKMQAATIKVREPKPPFGEMRISGLEPLTVDKGLGFMNVGERCNIAGSIKFKKLILNGDYDKALAYC